jgi:hypothetical protein
MQICVEPALVSSLIATMITDREGGKRYNSMRFLKSCPPSRISAWFPDYKDLSG